MLRYNAPSAFDRLVTLRHIYASMLLDRYFLPNEQGRVVRVATFPRTSHPKTAEAPHDSGTNSRPNARNRRNSYCGREVRRLVNAPQRRARCTVLGR